MQLSKAQLPMEVTPEGIVMDLIPDSPNAQSSMVLTEEGIVTAVTLVCP